MSMWKESKLSRRLLRRRLWRNVFSLVGPRYIEAGVDGFRLILDLRDRVGVSRIILKYGEFESFASAIAVQWLKPDMAAIDIGANIGYWSVLIARQT